MATVLGLVGPGYLKMALQACQFSPLTSHSYSSLVLHSSIPLPKPSSALPRRSSTSTAALSTSTTPNLLPALPLLTLQPHPGKTGLSGPQGSIGEYGHRPGPCRPRLFENGLTGLPLLNSHLSLVLPLVLQLPKPSSSLPRPSSTSTAALSTSTNPNSFPAFPFPSSPHLCQRRFT
jgi:hypothetical protein